MTEAEVLAVAAWDAPGAVWDAPGKTWDQTITEAARPPRELLTVAPLAPLSGGPGYG